ncbi:hypothetical protein [Streptomyces sp. NBC_01565]|uniref:hypothetical protein n=1 Tax=unclassified Streptomyces TaxID=2593676 RepID=UPI00225C03E1|nr:hypothetical protein [Streptomyces sp. NBC_01565]MCX4545869.1 hypothetical protein [Streptomyces sp. NBC_01565]
MSADSVHTHSDSPALSPAPRRTRTVAAYGVVGLVMAAVWIHGGDTPAWEHALRVLALVLGISAIARLAGPRLVRGGRAPLDRGLFFGLLAGKVVLVAVALLVDWLAGLWFSDPTLITAACLFAAVAAGGPALHDALSHGGPGRRAHATR